MVAQVIAAPVMVVTNVATTIVKTGVSIAMKVGTTAAKAGLSAARTVGTAVRSGVTNSVTTASKAMKGLSSMRTGPLASRVSALSSARSRASRLTAPNVSRPTVSSRSPIGDAVRQANKRSEARFRAGLGLSSHSIDHRDRMIALVVVQAMKPQNAKAQSKGTGMMMQMAEFIEKSAKKLIHAAGAAAGMPGHQDLAERHRMAEQQSDMGPSLER